VSPLRLFCSLLLALACACSSPAPQQPKPAKKDAAAESPKIVHFYASPGTIPRGGHSTVCYGVENAASVRLDPAVETLTPSFNRCFPVSPPATTQYTLTAVSSAGREVSQTFAITVGAAAPPPPSPSALILFFTPSANEARAGQPVTICYGVKGAVRVSLKPSVRAIEPLERACFAASFQSTTTLTLTAFDTAGRTDTESVTIRVAR
jgi:hypothetical protein